MTRPKKTNLTAIRKAIRNASNRLETDSHDLKVELDEATRNEAGSPNIPLNILNKIRESDAFVCDITTINSSAPNGLRRTPNPNVVFELGYAVAHLGWNRIVLLFNEAYGKFPDDMPFDFDRHRASPYYFLDTDPDRKANDAKLVDLLTNALIAIQRKNAPRPLSGVIQNPEEVKRRKDIDNLKWVLSTLHLPTIDQMIQDLPKYLNAKALHFWESFNAVVCNPLFHLYDLESFAEIKAMHKAWHICISNGDHYDASPNANILIFTNSGDLPLNAKQRRIWKRIKEARDSFQIAQQKLFEIVRDQYLEIDLNETNSAAWQEYIEFHQDN